MKASELIELLRHFPDDYVLGGFCHNIGNDEFKNYILHLGINDKGILNITPDCEYFS
jgi:hypothetical protein